MAAERTRGDSFTAHTTITCDFRQSNGDGCPDSTPMKGNTAARIRKVAKELGWSHVGGKDYCPAHTLETKARRRARANGLCEITAECQGEHHYGICPRRASGVMTPVPNKPKTPLRSLRVSDELWDKAKVRADERGETVSEAVRKFLERYVR